MNKYNQ